jgi:hypothetical protein
MKLGNESVITNQNMKTRRADEEKNYRSHQGKKSKVVQGSSSEGWCCRNRQCRNDNHTNQTSEKDFR